jgi:hypothetical protein
MSGKAFGVAASRSRENNSFAVLDHFGGAPRGANFELAVQSSISAFQPLPARNRRATDLTKMLRFNPMCTQPGKAAPLPSSQRALPRRTRVT